MADPWTGRPGEHVPAMLRHDLTPCGQRQRRCTRCEGSWWLDELPGEWELCDAAVAQRLAELEAHEASLHKHGARVRGEIVRWLRAAARDYSRRSGPLAGVGVNLAADAIARGDDADWCEAHPETSPAREGADAGRDPGREE